MCTYFLQEQNPQSHIFPVYQVYRLNKTSAEIAKKAARDVTEATGIKWKIPMLYILNAMQASLT